MREIHVLSLNDDGFAERVHCQSFGFEEAPRSWLGGSLFPFVSCDI